MLNLTALGDSFNKYNRKHCRKGKPIVINTMRRPKATCISVKLKINGVNTKFDNDNTEKIVNLQKNALRGSC